jgi:hypothetical protein
MSIMFNAWTNGDNKSGRDVLTERPTGGIVSDEGYIHQMYP